VRTLGSHWTVTLIEMSQRIRLSPPLSLLYAGPCRGGPDVPRLSDATPASDGVRYLLHESHLLIDARGLDGPLLRLAPWSLGLRLERWVEGWVVELRDLDPLPDPRRLRGPGRAAVAAFLGTVPKKARRLVPPSAHLQLTMLRSLQLSELYESLLRTGPIIAWLVAWMLADESLSAPRVDALAAQPRAAILREITRAAGMASARRAWSSADVRLVESIRFDTRSARELRALHRALEFPPLLESLRHRARPHAGQLLFLAGRRPYDVQRWATSLSVRPRSLQQLELARTFELENEVLDIANRIGRLPAARRALAAANELPQLEAIAARWRRLSEVRQRAPESSYEAHLDSAFPAPMLDGSGDIIPLLDVRALVEEGELMSHCVATQFRDGLSGRAAFYRVLSPERATLRVLQEGDEPRVDDLRLSANALPSDETKAVVDTWLTSALALHRARQRTKRAAG
jgi:hypothetical protein